MRRAFKNSRHFSNEKKGLPERIASKQRAASGGQITLENRFEVQRWSIG